MLLVLLHMRPTAAECISANRKAIMWRTFAQYVLPCPETWARSERRGIVRSVQGVYNSFSVRAC
jgi:hypothetical protein